MILNESQKAAEQAVKVFFDLLCKRGAEVKQFEPLIQSSYIVLQNEHAGKMDKSAVWDEEKKVFVSNKDRSKKINMKGWQTAVDSLLIKQPKSYRILKATQFGVNMVRFDIEVPTKFMKLIYCSPNVIRENDTWQINPVSAYPRNKRLK